MNKKHKSFTLIELLVVIVIIGILAGVIMISTSSSVNKATLAKATVFSSTVQEELLLNVVSGWSFDEGTGTVGNTVTASDITDDWGNYNGSIGNTPILKGDGCFSKKCVEFNSVDDDFISMSSFFGTALKGSSHVSINDYDKNATITAWANPFLLDATDRFVFSDNNWNEGYVALQSNQISARWGSGIISHSANPEQRWYFITITHKMDLTANVYRFHLYIDGQYVGSMAPSTIPMATSYGPDSTLRIGKFWNGLIDNIMIYDETLSSSQIREQYISGLNLMFSNGIISKEDYNLRIEELTYGKK